MDLQTRKIEFVQKFLKLQSEEVISKLENILSKSKSNLEKRVMEPISKFELNERIDKSESDFENDKFKTTEELLAKFK